MLTAFLGEEAEALQTGLDHGVQAFEEVAFLGGERTLRPAAPDAQDGVGARTVPEREMDEVIPRIQIRALLSEPAIVRGRILAENLAEAVELDAWMALKEGLDDREIGDRAAVGARAGHVVPRVEPVAVHDAVEQAARVVRYELVEQLKTCLPEAVEVNRAVQLGN